MFVSSFIISRRKLRTLLQTTHFLLALDSQKQLGCLGFSHELLALSHQTPEGEVLSSAFFEWVKNPLVSNLGASYETFLELSQSRFLLRLKTNLHKFGLVSKQLKIKHSIHVWWVVNILFSFWLCLNWDIQKAVEKQT